MNTIFLNFARGGRVLVVWNICHFTLWVLLCSTQGFRSGFVPLSWSILYQYVQLCREFVWFCGLFFLFSHAALAFRPKTILPSVFYITSWKLLSAYQCNCFRSVKCWSTNSCKCPGRASERLYIQRNHSAPDEGSCCNCTTLVRSCGRRWNVSAEKSGDPQAGCHILLTFLLLRLLPLWWCQKRWLFFYCFSKRKHQGDPRQHIWLWLPHKLLVHFCSTLWCKVANNG